MKASIWIESRLKILNETEPLWRSDSAQSYEKRTLVGVGEQMISLIDHAAEL